MSPKLLKEPGYTYLEAVNALYGDNVFGSSLMPQKMNSPVLVVPGVDRVVLESKNEPAGLLLNRRAPSSSPLLLLGYIDCRGPFRCTTT
jgi:hypothetical protein